MDEAACAVSTWGCGYVLVLTGTGWHGDQSPLRAVSLAWDVFLTLFCDIGFGCTAATAMGNFGDLTLAVVMSIGDSPPFSKGDAAVGIAYVL